MVIYGYSTLTYFPGHLQPEKRYLEPGHLGIGHKTI